MRKLKGVASPAQLRARAAFVKMVRAKAGGKVKRNPVKTNPAKTTRRNAATSPAQIHAADSALFKDLSIGDQFDFISPHNTYNSFYLRCTKTSARGYKDEQGRKYTVGSTSARVYHVTRKNPAKTTRRNAAAKHAPQMYVVWARKGRGKKHYWDNDKFIVSIHAAQHYAHLDAAKRDALFINKKARPGVQIGVDTHRPK
jgi:hypothetical protein